MGSFNQGVFLGFFTHTYGWSRMVLSFAPMLFYIWAGLFGVVVGQLIDRCGPRPILVGGAMLLGGGALALGLTRQLWQLYPVFLLLSTGYACLHTVTLGAIIARWFVQDRARAMVLVTSGGGLGGMVLSPLNAALLERWGGLAGGLTLAVLAIGVVVPLALWVVKDGPAALGLAADGKPTSVEAGSPELALADEPVWTLTQAMRTRAFWAIAVGFHLAMIAQVGFLTHQVPFLQPTFGLLVTACPLLAAILIRWAIPPTLGTNEVRNAVA